MSRGHDLERRVKRWLEDEGWTVVRAAGSLGFADLVALHFAHPTMFIEVKGDKGSPYSHFGPARQRVLTVAAERAGAEAWLCHIPPRARTPRWIASRDFPAIVKAKPGG